MEEKRIHAIHLLNDFSGSPLVFQICLNDYIRQGYEVHLYTASPSGQGFLSRVNAAKNISIFYKWSKNKWLTLFFYLWAQMSLFLCICANAKKSDTVYINTLLPFGAMWAAKLKRCKVIVHVHEVSLKPALLKRFLVFSAEHCATEIIFVSAFLQSQYNFSKPNSRVELNQLSQEFLDRIPAEKAKYATDEKTVLMLCSLKAYKGINEFIRIAELTPGVKFELVLNASPADVSVWISEQSIPKNCTCFSAQSDTHFFYARARIVMNLSRPNEWLETFGMTILEGIAYGALIVVPTKGAPKELLLNDDMGIAIDGSFVEAISNWIEVKMLM